MAFFFLKMLLEFFFLVPSVHIFPPFIFCLALSIFFLHFQSYFCHLKDVPSLECQTDRHNRNLADTQKRAKRAETQLEKRPYQFETQKSMDAFWLHSDFRFACFAIFPPFLFFLLPNTTQTSMLASIRNTFSFIPLFIHSVLFIR